MSTLISRLGKKIIVSQKYEVFVGSQQQMRSLRHPGAEQHPKGFAEA